MKKGITEKQRRDGKYHTPLPFAGKALEYIERTLGQGWWKSGEYRLWDMAAGTGNLEYYLPQDALKYCYLSTYYKEDVEHLQRLFSDCEVFQYDYLNDDVDYVFASNGGLKLALKWKMPEKLRKDLMNPKIKWIVLINPPFATAQEAGMKGKSKEGVSDTKIRQRMHAENFGEASRELYTQFLYRVKYEFKNCKANLGLFSKIKYLNANNDQKFRDSFFHCTFMQGFVFSSVNFHGTSRTSPFPISFILWDINKEKSLEKQNIVLDVFNNEVKKTETKQIVVRNRTGFLNKWIIRPPATIKFPPFGSAIEVKSKNIDRRDRVAENFLASFMCCGNDLYHQLNTALLSGPYVSAGAFSVTPENFEQAMVAHAARKIPKSSWFNDGDQFMKPNQDLSEEFITDCTIWNLFCNSNQTAALCNVKYEEKTYQIHNHFFPFKINEIKKWDIADNDIKETLFSAEDTFVAKWLSKRKLSEESRNVWNQAKKVYRFYFVNLNDLRTPKFKIETYDAGWWQIRQALQDAGLGGKELEKLKQFHNKLREKLLPQLSGYGMIE